MYFLISGSSCGGNGGGSEILQESERSIRQCEARYAGITIEEPGGSILAMGGWIRDGAICFFITLGPLKFG